LRLKKEEAEEDEEEEAREGEEDRRSWYCGIEAGEPSPPPDPDRTLTGCS